MSGFDYRITHFVRYTAADGGQRTVPVMAEDAAAAAEAATAFAPLAYRTIEVWEAGRGPWAFTPTVREESAPDA